MRVLHPVWEAFFGRSPYMSASPLVLAVYPHQVVRTDETHLVDEVARERQWQSYAVFVDDCDDAGEISNTCALDFDVRCGGGLGGGGGCLSTCRSGGGLGGIGGCLGVVGGGWRRGYRA